MVDGKWQMVVLVRSRMRTRTVLAAVRAPRRQTGLARKHQRNAAVCSAITGHFRLPREKNRLQAAKVSHRARACAASHGPPGPCTLLGPGSYLRSGASDLTTPFAGGIGSYFHTPGLGRLCVFCAAAGVAGVRCGRGRFDYGPGYPVLLTKGLFPRRAGASTERRPRSSSKAKKLLVPGPGLVFIITTTARRFMPRQTPRQPFDRFTISSEEEVLFTLGSRRPSRSP